MATHKIPRKKGKFSFMRYFQKFKEGDNVAVAKELSVVFGYPHRIQGKTGKVIAKRGRAYEVEINDFKSKKRYFIQPIHLIKIKTQ